MQRQGGPLLHKGVRYKFGGVRGLAMQGHSFGLRMAAPRPSRDVSSLRLPQRGEEAHTFLRTKQGCPVANL